MDEYHVRLIEKEELRGLLDLYKHLNNGDAELEESSILNELWESIYADPNLYYVVAEKDSLLVSTCTISVC